MAYDGYSIVGDRELNDFWKEQMERAAQKAELEARIRSDIRESKQLFGVYLEHGFATGTIPDHHDKILKSINAFLMKNQWNNIEVDKNCQKFKWSGRESPYVNEIKIDKCDQILIGRYGGNLKAGAFKNEDGALVWQGKDWELSMVLDGHNSSESVDLVIRTIEKEWSRILEIIHIPMKNVFQSIENHLLSVFQSRDFMNECQNVQGETACLICMRKENYLWWFSVGDCVAYLFHEELHRLGQHALNQRQFYEWIGSVNTFSLPVPCYSSGIRELRPGYNLILMLTDGILECGDRYYEVATNLYEEFFMQFDDSKLESSVKHILKYVHENVGRDSATLICWEYHNSFPAQLPSDQPRGVDRFV